MAPVIQHPSLWARVKMCQVEVSIFFFTIVRFSIDVDGGKRIATAAGYKLLWVMRFLYVVAGTSIRTRAASFRAIAA